MSPAVGQTASGDATQRIWVFHRGALGDSVLLWPRLRHWVRSGSQVTLVTDAAKATLAQREVGVRGVNVEQRRFNELWRADAEVSTEQGVQLVLDCVSGGGPAFCANLARMFPGALIQAGSPPRRGREARAWMSEHPLSGVAARRNEDGPVVVHVGAGSEAKRWPMERWEQLASRLRGERGWRFEVVAGEVEEERFGRGRDDRGARGERHRFDALGGRFVDDLMELADLIRGARLFIGCDSGPTHLAAQLGVSTPALFGPTDPSIWMPVGPRVRPVCPDRERAMDWLDVETVLREADVLLGAEECNEGGPDRGWARG